MGAAICERAGFAGVPAISEAFEDDGVPVVLFPIFFWEPVRGLIISGGI